MSLSSDVLSQLSDAIAARADAAKNAVAAVRLGERKYLTGILWQAGVVVVSEQALPRGEEFEVVAPGGATAFAKLAGRDASTNIAVLKAAESIVAPAFTAAEPRVGTLALAVGSDGAGAASARLGLVNLVGEEWHSRRGGLIDRRIVLDVALADREEGGPVFDVAGNCFGMSTFGPRGQVIVIPHATLARVVPQLIKDGHVARGWLGVALHAVAVPDALRESADLSSGMMVMSVVEGGPAAQAGIVAGDIILSVDGIAANRFRKIARYFSGDSIGRKADIRLIRGGSIITVQTTIAERRAA
ncbi:MAG TPA: S1C family serine protease [Bradyrhizobium sp.]|uniref:S1C family serine protease n=1 Tax=Bradyrhizobium sp. TaxID=376 RepID=UPI002D7E3A23|nr:S1C family serine protease [Bradyrhizobium sp.]HET7889788.1 S1C family serine protease [Bradyrhizobium sp.]